MISKKKVNVNIANISSSHAGSFVWLCDKLIQLELPTTLHSADNEIKIASQKVFPHSVDDVGVCWVNKTRRKERKEKQKRKKKTKKNILVTVKSRENLKSQFNQKSSLCSYCNIGWINHEKWIAEPIKLVKILQRSDSYTLASWFLALVTAKLRSDCICSGLRF